MAEFVIGVGRSGGDVLSKRGRIVTMISGLIVQLGMRQLGNVIVHEVELDVSKLGQEPFSDEGGITGTAAGGPFVAQAVLSTSDIAFHGWPLREFWRMHIHSCREFDLSIVQAYVVAALQSPTYRFKDVSHAVQWT
jgi:S-adenosylmethionine/arginine decarboxylase-like enzyme